MQKQELLDNYLSMVICSNTDKVVVSDNSVDLNNECNVIIDSLHLIKGVSLIKGGIEDGIRSIVFFDKDGLELHTIQPIGKDFYMVIKDLITYEENDATLMVCEIKTYDIESINIEAMDTYPRISYEINTVQMNDGNLAVELTGYLKPDLFNDKITLVKQPYKSMAELYLSFQSIINNISMNVPTIIGFLSGAEPYIVLNANMYRFDGLENNGIRVQLIDLYNNEENSVTFIPYKTLAESDYYTLTDDTYHIIDSRIFKGTEDFGNMKALRGVIEEGEGYSECLLLKLNKLIHQVQYVKEAEVEQEQKDSIMKNLLSVLNTVVDEIKESNVMDRLGDGRLLWYYKGTLLSLSEDELNTLQSDIDRMQATLDSDVAVEE